MSTVGIVVATFGDWGADDPRTQRALESARAQTHESLVIHSHADTLAQARNQGATLLGTEWLIFLDADDELSKNYVEEMLKAPGDIRQPSTLGIVDGVEDDEPVLIPEKDLTRSNYIVIGAMCRADLFFEVGGFDEYPIFEDWACWAKMVKRGAVVEPVPDAIYRVNVNPTGRNKDDKVARLWYDRIRRAIQEFQ